MKSRAIPSASGLLLGVVIASWSSPSPAQQAPTAVEPATPAARTQTRPNRSMLLLSFFTLGQSYVASMGIAATSRHYGDANLWIPALGPWLDLGARPGCPSSTECGSENGNRVLLVADGLLQTFGAFQLAGAFLWPETVVVAPLVTTASGVSVSVAPGHVGGSGYGLAAVGQF